MDKKNIIIISLIVVVALGLGVLVFALNTSKPTGYAVSEPIGDINNLKEFNDCLAENGIVIYGSVTCFGCRSLVENLGGHDAVASVYVECTEQRNICNENKQTGYVPEIHFNGQLYQGQRTLEGFSQITGCSVPK